MQAKEYQSVFSCLFHCDISKIEMLISVRCLKELWLQRRRVIARDDSPDIFDDEFDAEMSSGTLFGGKLTYTIEQKLNDPKFSHPELIEKKCGSGMYLC